jgi:hypothetical protein
MLQQCLTITTSIKIKEARTTIRCGREKGQLTSGALFVGAAPLKAGDVFNQIATMAFSKIASLLESRIAALGSGASVADFTAFSDFTQGCAQRF